MLRRCVTEMSENYTMQDLVRVKVVSDYDQMSDVASELVIGLLKQRPQSVIGFATGGTPVGLYKRLVSAYERRDIDFSQVTTFNLDEYLGLERSNPNSYCYYMYENLFSLVNVRHENVFIPDGMSQSPERACEEYENAILHAGGIDLQILGIGSNGHIGFNEPGTAFGCSTHIVALADETVKANARFFDSDELVPRHAISMGIKSIMRARQIVHSRPKKAHAMARALPH